MASVGELTFEEVRTWRVDALKEFLKKRDLKTSGIKEELVARVFAASEMGIAIKPTCEELSSKRHKERCELLVTPTETLPDPLSLAEGWQKEDVGITSWPPIFLSDITIFLMRDHPGKDVDLNTRLLNEYKEGKAYRLYESGFLKEISYHEIKNDSSYCFLKAKCTHSMKVKDTPHTTWVCAEKQSGKIFSAHCSCVAGMGSTCIHVSALLFRVEAANKAGITNPACTSRPCVWNVPKGDKTEIKPMQISEMVFKAAKHNKDLKRPLVDVRKSLFTSSTRDDLSNSEKRQLLYGGLKQSLPKSCFIKTMKAEEEEDRQCHQLTTSKKNLTVKDIYDIEQATIGQAENVNWHAFRKGRITASIFHRVFTRAETLKEKGGDASNLVAQILGKNSPPENTPALKYGREMEPVAKEKYLDLFKSQHTDVNYRECGIFINSKHQFLGASPDLLVDCSCCGLGLLEVKCPYSIVNQEPSEENLPYLVSIDGVTQLKKRTLYYSQIQGQMAISGRHWCHFLVYTAKGLHLELIHFDEGYWNTIRDNLVWFHDNYLVHLKEMNR